MLRKILAVTGRPGLYELVSQGKNCLIVESLNPDKKRLPVFNNEKVMSLADVAIYTTEGEEPLGTVFESIYKKFEGKPVDVKELEKNGSIRYLFGEILPDFDEDRVRTSDIKKVFSWYNVLLGAGFEKFVDEDKEAEKDQKEPTKEEEK